MWNILTKVLLDNDRPFHFNSRCGDSSDFIVGVDSLCERNIVDFKSNAFGDILIEFLINANMCILNGRNYVTNDFTSISTKGCSVVDYCLLSHDNLSLFSDFSVVRAVDAVNLCNNICGIAPTGIPDHSLITWCINFEKTSVFTTTANLTDGYDKFDVHSIPNDFLTSNVILTKVNAAIADLEGSLRSQTDIDVAFGGWCDIVNHEMYDRLPFRSVCCGVNNKKRRPGKPWWNNSLTDLWNDVCKSEKDWLNCNSMTMKRKLKSDYCYARKLFDKEVQRSKRHHWYKMQHDILNDVNTDPKEFWKTIGKVGIHNSKKLTIPMEVLLGDGSLTTDVKEVLSKWEKDYSNLYNSSTSPIENTTSNNNFNNTGTSSILDDHISILEVIKAIDNAKKGKAYGIDKIPVDVLKNDNSVYFLHFLFNVCFNTGCIPSSWGKSIINPIPKSSSADIKDPSLV